VVTQEDLQVYVRGQMEIQNPTEGYLCRGEIAEIKLGEENFTVRLAWLAMKRGRPPLYADGQWEPQQDLDYEVPSSIGFSIQKTPGGPGEPDRVIVQSGISNEMVVLFHKNKEELFDPTSVPGLNIPA